MTLFLSGQFPLHHRSLWKCGNSHPGNPAELRSPSSDFILIPGLCECTCYITWQKGIKVMDGIKVIHQQAFKWGDHLGLCGWTNVITGSFNMGNTARWRERPQPRITGGLWKLKKSKGMDSPQSLQRNAALLSGCSGTALSLAG